VTGAGLFFASIDEGSLKVCCKPENAFRKLEAKTVCRINLGAVGKRAEDMDQPVTA